MSEIFVQTKMVGQVCINCGIAFAIDAAYDAALRDSHQNFYCPNGHGQHYSAKTEAEKLAVQLAQERAAHDQTRASVRDGNLRIAKLDEELQRSKKRTANGSCPCCKRNFANLHRHMKSKHTDYAKGAPS